MGQKTVNNRNIRSIKRRQEKKRSVLALVLTALTLLSVVGTLFVVRQYLKVRDVAVYGNRHLKREDFDGLLGIRKGDDLFALSSKEVFNRLKKSPWVREAAVRRDLSGRLLVKVDESVPAAILSSGGVSYLVSEDGVVLEQMREGAIFLPVLADMDPAKDREAYLEALNLVKVLRARGSAAYSRGITVAGRSPEELTLKSDDISIKIGAGEFEKKLDRLAFVRDELVKRKMNVQYIDLRFDNKVIVRQASGETVLGKDR